MEQPQRLTGDSDSLESDYQAHNHSIVAPAQLLSGADGFEKKEKSWFAISQIPTDLSIQVGDVTFHVHKYPLLARCGYLSRMELKPQNSDSHYDLKLENLPGGPETFEVILKFCYGLPVNLNPINIASLRCASEYLEMTEALEDGNLISKTEAFFTFVVLSSWKDTFSVLNSCEALYPWVENLQIIRRCCDSIALKISRENSHIKENTSEEQWWLEDVADLRIDHFTRIMTSVRAKGTQPEIIGSCIMYYADKWLPRIDEWKEGIGRHVYGKNELQWSVKSGTIQEEVAGQTKEHRMIIESLVSMLLPLQKGAVSCKFLLRTLRMAMEYSASEALISELEKRVGMVLEQANVNDLLIPSYPVPVQGKHINLIEENTMLNIEVVQRILEYFLMYEQQHQQQPKASSIVSKLLDSYLAEIAKDPNLSIVKFRALAESLPETARTCDDGLYRAIDMFLKSHPSLPEHESRRLCKIMNCDKLSLDACKHAAQNDRLPVRTAIQVLFSEQVKMRSEIQGKDQKRSDENSDYEVNWSADEAKMLKVELEMVKAKMVELQEDYFELQQEYRKLDNKHRTLSGWTFAWLKNKKLSFPQGTVNRQDAVKGAKRSSSDLKTRFSQRKSVS